MNVTWWYPYHPPSPPRQTCARGNLLSLEKKKEEKIKAWNLDGSLALTGILCNTHLRQSCIYNMKSTRNVKHTILLTMHKEVPGSVQRVACLLARLVQTGVAGNLSERYAAASTGFGSSAACWPYRYHDKKPGQPPLMGRTYEGARYSRSCSLASPLRSPGRQRQAW